MTESVVSRAGVPIRLTDERWAHIVEEHAELVGLRTETLETVANPNRILAGGAGELLAVRMVDNEPALVVPYRETSEIDGFVITAFVTRRLVQLGKRDQLWPPRT